MRTNGDTAENARDEAIRDPVLARFVLRGAACAIVPRSNISRQECLGSFELRGKHYVVLKLSEEAAPDLLDVLTPRELQIAMLVAAGCEIKEVGRRLRISFHTVRVHLGRIYCKLGLHKQTELAVLISTRHGFALEGELESSRVGRRILSASVVSMVMLQVLFIPIFS